jgi:hypothetical protein
VAGGIAGAIGGAMMAGIFKALARDRGPVPITRHTGFLDFTLGGGSISGLPDHDGGQGVVSIRTRVGYRSPPITEDLGGLALELAFVTGFRGGANVDGEEAEAGDEESTGFGLTSLGGELRLVFRARSVFQPYLLAGCSYVGLSMARDRDGLGLQAGGGFQYWFHRHFAVEVGLIYEMGHFRQVYTALETQLHGITAGLGFKIYF